MTVEAGSKFLVMTTEKTNGFFPWNEPADTTVYKCVQILNRNFGDFTTGYRIYEV